MKASKKKMTPEKEDTSKKVAQKKERILKELKSIVGEKNATADEHIIDFRINNAI